MWVQGAWLLHHRVTSQREFLAKSRQFAIAQLDREDRAQADTLSMSVCSICMYLL